MRFDIISVLPDLLTSPFAHSILQRAQKKGIAEIVVHNLRDYATNKQKSVDDYPYGGGSGMVMSIPNLLLLCIEKAPSRKRSYDEVIFMSPDGETFKPRDSQSPYLVKTNVIILCGHYKGIDQSV
jgi:tRNA (guanine37-N1)-methyltransferase